MLELITNFEALKPNYVVKNLLIAPIFLLEARDSLGSIWWFKPLFMYLELEDPCLGPNSLVFFPQPWYMPKGPFIL